MPAIYVSDWRRHCVWRLTGLGDLAPGQLGRPGGGVGQFHTPCGLAVDSLGRLYVADRGNHRIVRVDDLDGSGWASFGALGPAAGQLRWPTDVYLDAADRLLIADTGNNRIVRVDDLDGSGWTSYGVGGRPTAGDQGVGKLAEPTGVCADGQGRICVVDRGNGRLVRIDDLDGSGWVTFGPAAAGDAHLDGPMSVRPDAAGTVVVADFGRRRLLRLDDLGAAGVESIIPATGAEPGLLGPTCATPIAGADGDGNPAVHLLVVDAPSRRLLELARDQNGVWALAGQQLHVGGDGARLYGLGAGPA